MKLVIVNTNIHQDAEGRYSLNDLHKAAVGAGHDYKTCQVEHFMRNDKTQELVDEIRKNGELKTDPVVSKAGRYGGTYVAKELVYAYAMWISPKFHLQVIRAYDALVTGQAPKALSHSAMKGAMEAHFMVIEAMKKIGVRNEMAMAVGLQAIHEDTGLTMEGYRLALPKIEEVCTLNQGQLGEIMGLSARAVGTRLRDAGLLTEDESGDRVITEADRAYGEMKPFTRNGHSGYEPRWNKSVTHVISEHLLDSVVM